MYVALTNSRRRLARRKLKGLKGLVTGNLANQTDQVLPGVPDSFNEVGWDIKELQLLFLVLLSSQDTEDIYKFFLRLAQKPTEKRFCLASFLLNVALFKKNSIQAHCLDF